MDTTSGNMYLCLVVLVLHLGPTTEVQRVYIGSFGTIHVKAKLSHTRVRNLVHINNVSGPIGIAYFILYLDSSNKPINKRFKQLVRN